MIFCISICTNMMWTDFNLIKIYYKWMNNLRFCNSKIQQYICKLLFNRLHNTDFITFHWFFPIPPFLSLSLSIQNELKSFHLSAPRHTIVVTTCIHFFYSEKKELCRKSFKQKELHLCAKRINILFLQKGSIYIPINILNTVQTTVYLNVHSGSP